VFSNRQIFLEHLHLPQAGSVANIPESAVHFRGNKRVHGSNSNSLRSPIALLGISHLLLRAEVDVESSPTPGEIGEERPPQTIFVLAKKRGYGFILKCTLQ
jgi:hypothetical protein